MRIVQSLQPTVTASPGMRRPVRLHIAGLRYEMTVSEALRLADSLADAAEGADGHSITGSSSVQ